VVKEHAEFPCPGIGTLKLWTSVARGGTIVITGGTTGLDVGLPLLPMLSKQINVRGTIMGTL
jgi:hypothetical protein